MQAPIRWRAPRRTVVSPPTIAVNTAVSSTDDTLTALLLNGISAGLVGGPWVDDLPRYVWHSDGDAVREFRLDEPATGRYAAYALHPSEWPEGLA
jgi:hypothetical protein